MQVSSFTVSKLLGGKKWQKYAILDTLFLIHRLSFKTFMGTVLTFSRIPILGRTKTVMSEAVWKKQQKTEVNCRNIDNMFETIMTSFR